MFMYLLGVVPYASHMQDRTSGTFSSPALEDVIALGGV